MRLMSPSEIFLHSTAKGEYIFMARKRWGMGREESKLWVKCPSCEKKVFKRLVFERGRVCPECNHPIPKELLDDGAELN